MYRQRLTILCGLTRFPSSRGGVDEDDMAPMARGFGVGVMAKLGLCERTKKLDLGHICLFCLLIVPLNSGTLLASRRLPSGSSPGSQIYTSLRLARLRLSPTAVTADVISWFTKNHTVRICVLRRLLDGINDRHISQSGYSEEVRFCILRTPTR